MATATKTRKSIKTTKTTKTKEEKMKIDTNYLLEMITSLQNRIEELESKRWKKVRRGSDIPEETVHKFHQMYQSGMKISEISRELGIKYSIVYSALRGYTRKEIYTQYNK